ncbi:beta-carotene 3-hydroxylase [Pedobacter cryoconitis]|uniref:Beta-carotene 3-hydroxylase n=1 Tax=Pedobacter cryoconitis TaxID=188932 RepID=A0A7W8ZJH2_9SPHI|nr:sterol desaturase family protein [Pedobacter cryoconitis]MBB5635015.1 beta-carotene 3-hydroxylase [Pedobacter cryoconitis]MBB6271801.1 beta-carotene 3-hydroxylase [Pedobacter cryoconitis]
MNSWIIYLFITTGTFIFMEGVAWFTHKFVMHGLLWVLHKDHHQKKPHFFEKNDAFFLIFATPSILLFFFGAKSGFNWMFYIGLGIFIYGIAYFIIHDVVIHQRFKWFSRSNNRYIKTIKRAHKIHHKYLDRHDGESFGMLYASRKYWQQSQKK